jgi:hypothetical protein
LATTDKQEDERRHARNKFEAKIIEIRNAGTWKKLSIDINRYENWYDGTTKEYKRELERLIELEKEVSL